MTYRRPPRHYTPSSISWGDAWRIGFMTALCLFLASCVFWLLFFVVGIGLAAMSG